MEIAYISHISHLYTGSMIVHLYVSEDIRAREARSRLVSQGCRAKDLFITSKRINNFKNFKLTYNDLTCNNLHYSSVVFVRLKYNRSTLQ